MTSWKRNINEIYESKLIEGRIYQMGKFLKLKKFDIDFLDCFMFFSPFLIGVFFEWTACLCSAVFVSYLIKKYYTGKKLEIPLGIPLLSYSVIFLGYILSDFFFCHPVII